MKRLTVLAVVASALTLLLASCSSGSSSTATTSTTSTTAATGVTTTTVSTSAVAQQVLSILTTDNANVQRDKAISDNSVALPKVAGDFSLAAQQLQALTYPASAQSDAKALVAILEKLSVDANQLNTSDPGLAQSVAQTLTSDEGTEAGDSGALRNDLGLPPVNTAS